MFNRKRREFIALAGAATLLAPLAASAQEAGRTYRLGFLYRPQKERRIILRCLRSCDEPVSSRAQT
jgi:hypothetical protein